MDVLLGFLQMLIFGIASYLNVFFSITVFGINFGALFLIGLIIAFVSWLVWG